MIRKLANDGDNAALTRPDLVALLLRIGKKMQASQ
jgi:hypothetical protein